MSDIHKSLRLGDLLVEKGLISAPQLRQAIELQKIRLMDKPEIPTPIKKYELGEILIELGFISRNQLNTNLSWQRRLRATTAMMVFVAPLLTAACGGGGGTSNGAGSNQPNQSVAAQVVPDSVEKISSSSVSSVAISKSSSSVSSAPAVIPKSSSSVSSSLSSSSLSSSSLSSKASSSASPVPPGIINGAVQIYWSVPTARENGDYLDITEIGGYEVRYKLKSADTYTVVVIKDGFIDAYYFDYLNGDYQFEIATFDRTGLYSKFIPVVPSS